jgi:hypothetical protein
MTATARFDRSIVEGPLPAAVWKIAWPSIFTNIKAARAGAAPPSGAVVAANPGEAVLQEAAGEELIHDLGDHRAPVATGRGEALVPHQADESGHSRQDQPPTDYTDNRRFTQLNA